MAVDLTIGTVTGNPPTGSPMYLHDKWTNGIQVGMYPSEPNPFYGDDKQIKKFGQLDGPGVLQMPVNDYRVRELVWKVVDLDVFGVTGGFIEELRQRRYVVSGVDYFLGSTIVQATSHSATFDVNNGSGKGTITAASGTPYSSFAANDRIVITGTADNNGLYVIDSVAGGNVITTTSVIAGADGSEGTTVIKRAEAQFFSENPIKIRIEDVLIEPVPNSENRAFVNVVMKFSRVT